jgi:hypothetical protein
MSSRISYFGWNSPGYKRGRSSAASRQWAMVLGRCSKNYWHLSARLTLFILTRQVVNSLGLYAMYKLSQLWYICYILDSFVPLKLVKFGTRSMLRARNTS